MGYSERTGEMRRLQDRIDASNAWDLDRKVEIAMEALRLPPPDATVTNLSGGEQRRVLLAQALCASQRLLILDEATTGLDLPAEQAFYHLLRDLNGELGLAILAVSHDLLALGALGVDGRTVEGRTGVFAGSTPELFGAT